MLEQEHGHRLWQRDDFAQTRSPLPRFHHRSVSICPALLGCVPAIEEGKKKIVLLLPGMQIDGNLLAL